MAYYMDYYVPTNDYYAVILYAYDMPIRSYGIPDHHFRYSSHPTSLSDETSTEDDDRVYNSYIYIYIGIRYAHNVTI
jgi:hypothetical protein